MTWENPKHGGIGLEEVVTVNTFQLLKLKYSFTEFMNMQQILLDRLINGTVDFVS